jgi:hypothetical protein
MKQKRLDKLSGFRGLPPASTAKPLPASPVRADSILAFNDKRLVCAAMSESHFEPNALVSFRFRYWSRSGWI